MVECSPHTRTVTVRLCLSVLALFFYCFSFSQETTGKKLHKKKEKNLLKTDAYIQNDLAIDFLQQSANYSFSVVGKKFYNSITPQYDIYHNFSIDNEFGISLKKASYALSYTYSRYFKYTGYDHILTFTATQTLIDQNLSAYTYQSIQKSFVFKSFVFTQGIDIFYKFKRNVYLSFDFSLNEENIRHFIPDYSLILSKNF